MNERPLISIDMIKRAVQGDPVALNKIVDHYDAYITKLATKRFYSDDGAVCYVIDEHKKRRLETKLLTAILKYKL